LGCSGAATSSAWGDESLDASGRGSVRGSVCRSCAGVESPAAGEGSAAGGSTLARLGGGSPAGDAIGPAGGATMHVGANAAL
jgi:hypothetical protein